MRAPRSLLDPSRSSPMRSPPPSDSASFAAILDGGNRVTGCKAKSLWRHAGRGVLYFLPRRLARVFYALGR